MCIRDRPQAIRRGQFASDEAISYSPVSSSPKERLRSEVQPVDEGQLAPELQAPDGECFLVEHEGELQPLDGVQAANEPACSRSSEL